MIKTDYCCSAFTDSLLSIFSFLELLSINLKRLYSHLKRGIIITSLYKKGTKVSRYNFKIDIKGVSGGLEMSKNIISV